MVTFGQLREARPAAWRDAAAGWRRLARAFVLRAEAVDRIRVRLAADWRGAAAAAAATALSMLAAALRGLRGPALACDQALSEHAHEVERIQRHLAVLLAAPASSRVTVTDDGSVELSSPQVRPDPSDFEAARRLAVQIGSLLAAATDSDEVARGRLRTAADEFGAALAPGADGGPAGGPAIPPAGTAPSAVRQWWDALAPADRVALLASQPDRLGALDGVPVAVRDTANRAVLDRLLGSTTDPHQRQALSVLADRLDEAGPARAYLIALDPAGDGRAVVAVGDPDHAAHVVTHVPGAGSDLGDLGGLLGRTDRVADAAAAGAANAWTSATWTASGPGGTLPGGAGASGTGPPRGGPVSAVLWLGYDAPEWASAAGVGAAQAGAAPLDRFVEGLRAGAAGPPAHLTVVGHSYGSLVVGIAARDHGLPVDDVVFVGSPGVGAQWAGDLGVPPGHVWSSTARHDAIRLTALADRWPEWPDGDVEMDRWHGANPDDPRFGAHTFTSAPGSWRHPVAAHNAYFDAGNPALAAIGAIAGGDYASVH